MTDVTTNPGRLPPPSEKDVLTAVPTTEPRA